MAGNNTQEKIATKLETDLAEFQENLRKLAEGVEYLLIGTQRQYSEAKRLKTRCDNLKIQAAALTSGKKEPDCHDGRSEQEKR